MAVRYKCTVVQAVTAEEAMLATVKKPKSMANKGSTINWTSILTNLGVSRVSVN